MIPRPEPTRPSRGIAAPGGGARYPPPAMDVDTFVERVRGVARTWSSWWPVPGPYTSVVVSDADTGMWEWPVSQRCALAVGAVYSALGIYADNIGTLPVQRIRGDYEHLPEPAFVSRPAGDTVGWAVEVGQICWSLLLRGNAYLLPTGWDWTGYPTTFVVLNPDAVQVTRNDNGRPRYSWRAPDGTDVVLDDPRTDQLLHIKWQVPPGSFLGVGILDVNGTPGSSLAGAVATEKYSAELMANPVPPAVLTHPLRLNKTQAEDLQAQWQSSVARARSVPAVLSGGITYSPLNVTPRDVELIESRRYNATSIATLFRVPPYMLGGSTGDALTYSTVEGEMTRLWAMTLQPMAMRLSRHLEAWLPAGQRLRFNPDALLRSQTLDRYNAHKIAIETGIETVDEARAIENRPPVGTPDEPAADAGTSAATQPVADAPPILEVV